MTPAFPAAVALLVLAAACSGSGEAGDAEPGQPSAEPEPPSAEAGPPSARPERPSGERGPPSAEPGRPSAQPERPSAEPASGEPAPWAAAPLPTGAVPGPLLEEWRAAGNRDGCALLAPGVVVPEEASARGATFAGGWGVAWDLPELRSAFGVAGTGVSPSPDTYDAWPHRVEWADGSHAGYGPEGGSGPKQLAYLVIPGQDCLYNVWSVLGREHLEDLLASLRYVGNGSGRGL